jgi:hypothetical protein
VVFFCVAGKLQVSIGARPVSVLGSGNCFGDWGVRHPKQLHLVHLPAAAGCPGSIMMP